MDKFNLGRLVITRNALEKLDDLSVMGAVECHRHGDWGEICDADKQINEDALLNGDRLLSAYRDCNDTKFWIITEADRSVTTVLLPEDY